MQSTWTKKGLPLIFIFCVYTYILGMNSMNEYMLWKISHQQCIWTLLLKLSPQRLAFSNSWSRYSASASAAPRTHYHQTLSCNKSMNSKNTEILGAPHVNRFGKGCHGSCDVPGLSSTLRIGPAVGKVEDWEQSKWLLKETEMMINTRAGLLSPLLFRSSWWEIILVTFPNRYGDHLRLSLYDRSLPPFLWGSSSFSTSPHPTHLAVRGMPTGREAATSSFFPSAPLLLQGMWIPSSASESCIWKE